MSTDHGEEKKVSATGQNTQSNASMGKSLKISAGLVVLLIGAMAFVTLKESEPIRKPKPLPEPLVVPGSVRKDVAQRTARLSTKTERTATQEETVQSNPVKRPKDLDGTAQALREDLLDIAPGVYTGVRLAMDDKMAVDEKAKIEQLRKRLNVNYVEITTDAASWDKLKSDQKVDLLNGTVAFLKKQYPALSQYVRVVFDDDRQALDLKFDDFRKVVDAG